MTGAAHALPASGAHVPVPPELEPHRWAVKCEVARREFAPAIQGQVKPSQGYSISHAEHVAHVREAIDAVRNRLVDLRHAARPRERQDQGGPSKRAAAEARDAGGVGDLPDPARGPTRVSRLHERRASSDAGDPATRAFLDALARAVAECFVKELPRAEEAPCE